MVSVALSLVAVFGILLVAELLWNKNVLKGEAGRKFVHISVGTFVAFWPFYMSLNYIKLIALAFLVVVLLTRYLNIFKVVHAVDRRSWGDVMFAIGIGIAAVLSKSDLVFTAAVLHLSLADGLAAIVGNIIKNNHPYKILGYNKSVAGSLAFWAVSVLIICSVMIAAQTPFGVMLAYAVILPIAATAAENIGINGLDNLFVPILVINALNQIALVL